VEARDAVVAWKVGVGEGEAEAGAVASVGEVGVVERGGELNGRRPGHRAWAPVPGPVAAGVGFPQPRRLLRDLTLAGGSPVAEWRSPRAPRERRPLVTGHDTVRDCQARLARLAAAHRRAVVRWQTAARRREAVVAEQDRRVEAAGVDVTRAVAAMADGVGVELTARVLGIGAGEVRRAQREGGTGTPVDGVAGVGRG